MNTSVFGAATRSDKERAFSYSNKSNQKEKSHYKKGHLEWIVTLKDGDIIGSIILYDSDSPRKEMAYIFAKKIWGNGYATEAVMGITEYLLTYGFCEELYAKHIIENPASGRVLLKSGFRRKSILKNAFVDRKGCLHDCIEYVIKKKDIFIG